MLIKTKLNHICTRGNRKVLSRKYFLRSAALWEWRYTNDRGFHREYSHQMAWQCNGRKPKYKGLKMVVRMQSSMPYERRNVIHFVWVKGDTPTDIHKAIAPVYSEDVISLQWCNVGIKLLTKTDKNWVINCGVNDVLVESDRNCRPALKALHQHCTIRNDTKS